MIIAIFSLAYYTFRRVQQIVNRQQQTARARKPDNHGWGNKTQSKMQPCHYCKVHLPEQYALKVDDRWYCSQDHYLADHNRTDT
jgi:hypothetical protein